MLINIEGTLSENGDLLYNVPHISLDRKYNYKIGVKLVHINFLESFQLSNNELLSIETNLIDLSSFNPTQTIFFFWNDSKKNIRQNSFVEDVSYFPLQVYETENCKISFKKFFSGEKLRIKNFFIQFVIQRSDILNGRFQ